MWFVHHGRRWELWGQGRNTRGGSNSRRGKGRRVLLHDDWGWRLLVLVRVPISADVWAEVGHRVVFCLAERRRRR